MRLLNTIGRMLLGAAIFRSLRGAPKWLLIAAALAGLALMSIGTARAQSVDYSRCMDDTSSVGNCSNDAAARAGATSHAIAQCKRLYPTATGAHFRRWQDEEPGRRFRAVANCSSAGTTNTVGGFRNVVPCPNGLDPDPVTGGCNQRCTSRDDITVSRPPFSPVGMGNPSNFGQCVSGCYVQFSKQDTVFVGVHTSNAKCDRDGQPEGETCNAVGRVSGPWGCVDPPKECEAGQVKDPVTGECSGSNCPAGMMVDASGACRPESNTCPPGQIKSPTGSCLPGEGQCAAGEARGKDGTCKKDSNGDGTPDSEQGGEDGEGPGDDEAEPDSFSGGDNCNNPPSCSGSPVMCGQARIQWRIECNTRRSVNITGGTCGNEPRCVGENCNAMEYGQLLQQWRTACTLAKMAQGTASVGRDGLLDWAQDTRAADTDAANAIAAQGDGLDGISVSDAWRKPTDGEGQGIRENLFGGGNVAQCSIAGNWTFVGHDINPGPQFWSLMQWVGWLMVALAYLWLAQKLGD